MRMPTFSRQSGATRSNDDEPTLVDTPAVPVRERDDETTVRNRPVSAQRISTAEPVHTDRRHPDQRHPDQRHPDQRHPARRHPGNEPNTPPAVTGPRPRASLLATLALITGVASALLVLSGPLAGYGIGLAVLALILSLGGISATGRRHVAGKSDAIIGLLLALGAIVVGVLALTGSLSWLGTDVDTATRVREWLDTQFERRF